MANQISVNTGSGSGAQQVIVDSNGNITVTVSRSVIGTVANVASANYANFAGTVITAAQPNITSVGNLTTLNVVGTTTTGNLVVTGNLQVGNLVANSANYANFAGTAFAVAGANVSGTVANATFATTAGSANTANSATVANSANAVAGANVSGTVANATFATTAGSANTANSATVANSANSVAGANVSGTVANATYADNAGNANFANSATVASSANSVTLANVSGAGNIASINLDGSGSNVLYGNGIFAPAAGGNTANANYANFAGNAFSVDGGNVVGAVANANFALDAGNANIANIAYSVDGANVSGTVANATFALDAGNANIANIAYSVDGANVSGTVANATFALDAGNANIANIAYSVDAANVSGLGNIATINLDGNASNFLDGTGNFVAAPGGANANYANFAGQAIDATQSNIKQTGNLVSLTINNAVADTVTSRYDPNLIAIPTLSNFPNALSVIDSSGVSGSPQTPAVNYLTKGRPSGAAANSGDIVARTVYGARATGGNILFAGDTFNTIRSTPNVANAYVAGQVTWRVPQTQSNLANANTSTLGQISMTQSGTFTIGAGAPGSSGIAVTTYGTQNGMISNTASATALSIARRRGNADAATTVEPNDYLGDIIWNGVTATQAGTQSARIRPRVDSGYTAGSNLIPIGFELVTVGNAGNTNTHFLYANGNVQFNNAVNANIMTANYLYGDGSNITGITANATPAGSNTQIQYNSNGAFGASSALTFDGGNLTVGGNLFLNTNSSSQAIVVNQEGSGGISSYNMHNDTSVFTVQGFYRTRGNASAQTAVSTNDTIFTQNYSVYGDSGNTFVNAGYQENKVGTNYGNGQVSLVSSFVASYTGSSFNVNGYDNIYLNGTVNAGNVQINGNTRQVTLYGLGEQPPANGVYSQLNVLNGAVQVSQDNIGGGLGSFSFNQWENTTSYLNPYAFFRARGNSSSPQPVANGDAVMTQSFIAYGDSGNTYVPLGTFGAYVNTNDGAGNVSAAISLGTANNDDGSTVQLYSDIIQLDGNSQVNITGANISLNGNAQITGTNTFMQLSVYTASALSAITGQVGQIAIVSDSGGGGNPNGMMAFWDTTNSQWSYVHDNSAV